MPYSVKGVYEINEDMVQILLMLEVLFTQDSKVEDLFCGASSGSEPSLFFSNYFFSLGFKPIQDFAKTYILVFTINKKKIKKKRRGSLGCSIGDRGI